MTRIWLLVAALCFTAQLHAGEVDTVRIFSKAMGRAYNCIVIKPANYSTGKKAYATVYLLHGHGGSFSNWYTRVPRLADYATTYNLVIVCPEGKAAGWYFDSPVTDSMQFETYVSQEIPAFIDAHYNTVKTRNGRAITGLSMGGHGGMYLGLKHADIFGACGSMSGALLIPMITDKRYGIDKILKDTSTYYEYSVMYLLDHYPKDSLAIIMDCGTQDFVFLMSRQVHEKMSALHIPHDYIERPGKHDWAYWSNAVQYQLLFFRNYFNRSLPFNK